VDCEGLELHILHVPHMDSIDLDPQPILGIGSDIWNMERIWDRFGRKPFSFKPKESVSGL
jgi:hypothetical protein